MNKILHKSLFINFYLFTFVFSLLTFSLSAQTGLRLNGAKLIIPSGATVWIDGGQNGDFTADNVSTAEAKVDLDGTLKLEGDWVNNNATDAILINRDSDGKVEFAGTSTQYFSGASIDDFYLEDMQINSGATLELADDQTLTLVDDLILNGAYIHKSSSSFTASFIFNEVSGNGSATVERYVENTDWHLVSIPVTTATAGIFYGMYLYYWDEQTQSWSNYTSMSQSLTTDPVFGNLKGYYVKDALNGAKTVDFQGMLVGSDFTLSNLSYTSSGTFAGSHLIGNPYTSAIDLESFFDNANSNVGSTVYQRSGASSYATYQDGGTQTNGGTQFIPQGQAFWIEVSNASNTLKIDRGDRSHSTTAFRASEPMERIYLKIEDEENYSDEVAVVFSDRGTNGYDPLWDASKMFADNPDVPQIYSVLKNGKEVCINQLSEIYRDEVEKVNLSTNLSEGYYTISPRFENLEAGRIVYLEDLKTGEMTNLLSDIYSFSSEKGESSRDFILHFMLSTSPQDDSTIVWGNDDSTSHIHKGENLNLNAYSYKNTVYIQNPDGLKNLRYSLYDLSGKLLEDGNIEPGLNRIETHLAKSMYIIRFNSLDLIIGSQKLFID